MEGHCPYLEKWIFEDLYLTFSLRRTPCIDVYLATWHILLKWAETHVIYTPACGLSWWMFHGHLKRMCIWLLLDGVFYTVQVFLFTLVVSLLVPSINKRRVFKFPTIIADLFISPFSFASCLMYFDSLLIGCVHIWNYFAFLKISPFIIIKCPYSSLVIPYPEVYFIWY